MNKIIINKKTIEGVELFIFDKDGTIIDIHYYWGAIIKLRAKFLVEKYFSEFNQNVYNALIESMGLDPKKNKLKPEGPVGIKPRSFIISTVHNTLLNYYSKVSNDDVSEIFKEVDVYANSKLSEYIKPLPYVSECLEQLKEAGIFAAVATSDLTERARMTMSILGIGDYFDFYIGGDKAQPKPLPDMVNLSIARFNAKVGNTFVIGDSIADLNLAKNAGCRFIGVKTGLYNKAFLEESEIIVETLNDIKIV